MNTLAETDKVYIAGIIDREGHIYGGRKAKFANPSLTVRMTDRALIYWLCETTGLGAVSRHPAPRGKTWWRWSLGTRQSALILRAALPYLKVKRRHAELFIEMQQFRRYHYTDRKLYVFFWKVSVDALLTEIDALNSALQEE